MAAAMAVLNTAELREMILFRLDNRTLLLSQRVSRNFKTSIEQSPEIQEKLFFRQGSVSSIIKRQRQLGEAINPLLFEAPGKFGGLAFKIRGHEGLCDIGPGGARFHSKSRCFVFGLIFFSNPLLKAFVEEPLASESWRRMYVFKAGFGAEGRHLVGNYIAEQANGLDEMIMADAPALHGRTLAEYAMINYEDRKLSSK